jgi:flagellar hook-associated protein 1 FlgK
MSLGIRAMAANYAALQTTGHNISNANVKGYSRQQVELATAQGQFTGAGFFGKGVNVVSVTRLHNAFLTREADVAKSLSAMDAARLQHLKRMENVFQPGEHGLGAAAADLFSAMTDLGSNPSDLATRQVVLARAGDLASRFAAAGAALDEVQAGVAAEVKASVARINALAEGIAQANDRVAALRGLGQPANDLLDERERLISQLSEEVAVTRVEASDGTLAIFVGGGQRLVLGNQAERLSVQRDKVDPTQIAVGVADGAAVRTLDSHVIAGGKLAGLLRFQSQDLTQGRNLIGQLALAVGGALNAQQLRGVNLQQPLGGVPSREMFAFGPSLGVPHGDNTRDGGGSPIGGVTLTIVDPAAVQASDYELRESSSTPGAWQLTRLSDGLVRTVNAGDVVDGVQIDITSPQPGDRFLLQPAARAANGMGLLLTDPRDLAAASPLIARTPLSNTGTAAVTRLGVDAAPLPVPGGTATIAFTSDNGDYSWNVLDGGGSIVASGSGNWQPGQRLPAPPMDINGFSLTLDGVPRNGDVIEVLPTPAGALAHNNGNALSLLALRDAALVGGHTVGDAWSQALAEVGVRTQSASTATEMSTAVAQQAEQMRSSASGVNLDEEAARLIQFQQSYQAAAKVLQIAQQLFDTLMDTATR